MGRPPKSHLQLVTENKSHRTKAELELRKKGEESLLTKVKIKEFDDVKKNKIAHKEFKRITNLLEVIDKNDDLFAGALNRYCILKAECTELEEKRELFCENIKELKKAWEEEQGKDEKEMTKFEYFKLLTSMESNVVALDKQVMSKRKMLLDIEKENLMTIASALRSIPKTPPEKVGEDDADMFDELFSN